MDIWPDQVWDRLPDRLAGKSDRLFVLPKLVQRARFQRQIGPQTWVAGAETQSYIELFQRLLPYFPHFLRSISA